MPGTISTLGRRAAVKQGTHPQGAAWDALSILSRSMPTQAACVDDKLSNRGGRNQRHLRSPAVLSREIRGYAACNIVTLQLCSSVSVEADETAAPTDWILQITMRAFFAVWFLAL